MRTLLIIACCVTLPLAGWAQGEAAGTIKATTKLRPDGSKAVTVVDPDKCTAEQTEESASGKLLKRTVFNLNENNYAIGATYYDSKNQVRYKERYTLDEQNRVKTSEIFSAAGQPMGRRDFTYDGKGGTSVVDYDSRGVLMTRPTTTGRGRPDQPTVRKALPLR